MNKSTIFKKLLKSADEFKVTTIYWDHDVLQKGENPIRNRPAPWIKKTLDFINIIGGNTVVEIGSTRMQVSRNCLTYYDNSLSMDNSESPPCCQDGHSTYFWAQAGLDTYTVDINPHCEKVINSCYKIKEGDPDWRSPKPDNLFIHSEDGINFLKNFDKKICLLFLDGWDKGTANYAENHLEAFKAAEDKLSDLHLVSIDDTDFNTSAAGKDKLLTPYLIDKGYVKLLWGRQTVYFNFF